MKKTNKLKAVATFVFITLIGILLIGIVLWLKPWITFENSFPDEGVWYCKDNCIAIDFDLMKEYGNKRCAVKYSTPDKTTYEIVYPSITMNSNQILIESAELDTIYLRGYAYYSDNIFKIKSDSSDETYTFVKIPDETLNDELASLNN